ncbi:MAG: LacI family DNA-binding transcriptional regulator [Deltaproteobacteria bacterium]|nr:LacI family DNA-binding transcriptional regulator [Deltaproteobacteria bacterium]
MELVKKKSRATIKDIAAAINLSYATVSRALNDHPKISQSTKALVNETAEKLGYYPNFFAKSLAKKKSNLIGLLVYDFQNTFYPELTKAIQDSAEELGYWVIQANTDDQLRKTESLVNSMISTGVEGIIFASVRLDDTVVERLIERQFPVVMANRRLGREVGDYVVMDNRYGAFLAVDHLIDFNYRRIAMIKGPDYVSTGIERFQGYLDALEKNGIAKDDGLIIDGFFNEESGYQATRRLMRLEKPPEAIFCADDEIALGSLRALDEMHLVVPNDVAMVGFDDSHLSSHPRLQLTTVKQDVKKIGQLVTDLLIRRIDDPVKSNERIILQPNLIIRQSSGFAIRNRKKAEKTRPRKT